MTSDGTRPRQESDVAERAGEPSSFDTGIAHPARIYDYWLGGKDNYEADRIAAERVIQVSANVLPGVRANRAFLRRAVEFLAGEAGIRQFLDIGTGLPTADHTHEVAQRIAPEARVVYVDNDPIVLAHSRALLASTPQGATDYIQADARDPGRIMAQAARTLDLTRPVAVMALMILQYIPDEDHPAAIVSRLMDSVPPGSYLAVSDTTRDIDSARITTANARMNQHMGSTTITSRTRSEIAGYFDGLDLVDPGLVHLPQWRAAASADFVIACLAGVARKPGRA